ncbi:MAG: AraC family transcriptional regulator ligand-binding domain-containing protein, partial [Perlucidibaca sp.]
APAAVTARYLRELLPAPTDHDALAACGISPDRLADDNHYRVPLFQVSALLARTLQAAGDPLLAIRQAHALSLRAFPLLGMGLLASTTLEEGLHRLIELDPLIWDAASLHLDIPEDRQAEAALVLVPRQPLPPALVELALAGWVLLGPALGRIADGGHRLDFRHRARAPEADYASAFGCPVSFGADAYAVRFPAAWLTCRLDLADPGSSGIIMQEARRQLAQPVLLNLENHLRAACFSALPGPLPELPALAATLGLAPRQLRQHMGERDIRLRDLQDDVRREAALHWLRHGDPDLCELAQACGFSEQSAFQRAFRRWTGMTPGQWRQVRSEDLIIDPFFA